jgi:hypothetical protein
MPTLHINQNYPAIILHPRRFSPWIAPHNNSVPGENTFCNMEDEYGAVKKLIGLLLVSY